MKKMLIICITLAVCLTNLYPSAAETTAEQKESGYWKQIRVDLLPKYSEPDYEYTYEIANGSSATHYSDVYGCSYQGSTAWTPPKDKYYPGDIVEITMSAKVDSYVSLDAIDIDSDNDSAVAILHKQNESIGDSVSVRYQNDIDDEGIFDYSFPPEPYVFKDANGKVNAYAYVKNGIMAVSSDTVTVYSPFLNHDSYTGETICLNVYTYYGDVQYIYQWTGEQEIIITGVVYGLDNNQLRPMPRIKTDVYVWYDKNKIPADWNSGTPDLTESAAADLNGAFLFKIPVPEKTGTIIGIIIKVTMRCILPQNKEVFFLADYQDANALNEIYVSTLISVDMSDEQYKNTDQIKISRAVQFHNLPLGFLTFDDKDNPEEMRTNLSDTYKFLGYSYMYRMLWDALTVGGVVFEELPSLMPTAAVDPLRVDCNYIKRAPLDIDCSHYSPSVNAIRLTENDCLFDDNSRYTVLHEFGHFFEGATNSGNARCAWQTKISAGDINHGGYLNKDTADSFVEGFATWYACVCQIYRKDFNPYQTGSWNIQNPETWKAWDLGGINEEMSVASVFANTMYLYDDIKTFWQNILRPDLGNFNEYYKAMIADFGADAKKIEILNNYITEAGLYRMPFGNNQYDVGEPYRDTNKNSVYDANDIYGDLMFAVDASGSIDTSKTLQVFDMKKAVLGESAANNFQVRKTKYLQPNSFIYLTGESAGTLKVTIKPKGQDAYSYTAYPADNKIYIGLTNTPTEGTIEISVPGGETIYKGDIAALQGQLNRTIGQTSALDYAEIKLSDLAPTGTVATPSGGNPDADAVFNPTAISNSEAEAMAADYNPEADIMSMTEQNISGSSGGVFMLLQKYFVFIIGIAAILIFIIIIFVIRRRRAVPVYAEQSVQPVYSAPVYKKTFCKSCGAKIKDDKHFCENCGRKID